MSDLVLYFIRGFSEATLTPYGNVVDAGLRRAKLNDAMVQHKAKSTCWVPKLVPLIYIGYGLVFFARALPFLKISSHSESVRGLDVPVFPC
jgi:hypothetical protein